MDFEKYQNQTAYPLRQDYYEEAQITIKTRSGGEFHRAKNIFNKESYIKAIREYHCVQKEKYDEFKADLLSELGIAGHSKADILFEMAYAREISDGGLIGVYEEAVRLSDLLS